MITLGLFFLLSILFSFLCSIWEAVLLSITPSYINTQKAQGTDLGKKLDAFKEDIDKPLSAILTLNTIAHTVGAIGVGAQAGKVFASSSGWIPGVSNESLIAAIMTLAILVLSEIIPKTIGANKWKSLAPFTVNSLSLVMKILAPFVWMSSFITKRLKKEKGKAVLSRADFLALTNVGISSGALQESESSIITNTLAMDQLKVQDVMTPRLVMQLLDENMSLQQFYDNHQPFRFSRIPLYQGKTDNITGTVLKDEILQALVEGKHAEPLSSLRRDVKLVDESKTLHDLFTYFTREKIQLAVVVDHFGSVTGIVTMEDVIETIIGLEIVDESDGVADLQALARKRWQERAKKIGIIE